MPDKSAQDKTEPATPQRKEKAREKGKVARSMELNSVAVLFAGILGLQLVSGGLIEGITTFMSSIYRNSSFISLTSTSVSAYASMTMNYFIPLIAPILILVLLAGLGINFAQVGIAISKKAMIPKFGKLNPLSGIKRIISLRSVVELIKGLFKIGLVSYVAFTVIRKHQGDYWLLSSLSNIQVGAFLAQLLFELSIKIGFVLLVLALADFAYQKWDYQKSLKMSKQDVKDEMKQHEGNPEVKGRIRNVQKQLSRKRMMAAIPDASVVVTNPTHYAIALKYKPLEKSDAPIVVAKGQRKIAQKIKEIAQQYNIPVIENKLLAKSLFEMTEIGMEIPVIFYQAVAEILTQVYQLNRGHNNLMRGFSYG